MPRVVDAEERAHAIVTAALETLADGGFATFSLRNIAKRMGGSMTLVTHYFPNRAALMDGILTRMHEDIASYRARAEQSENADAGERLRRVLLWGLPLDHYSLMLERARIALVAHRESDLAVDEFIERLEPVMRAVYTEAVASFVPSEDLEQIVDLIRSWTNGVGLSAVEHPDLWTPRRQLAAMEKFVEGILRTLDLPYALTSETRLPLKGS